MALSLADAHFTGLDGGRTAGAPAHRSRRGRPAALCLDKEIFPVNLHPLTLTLTLTPTPTAAGRSLETERPWRTNRSRPARPVAVRALWVAVLCLASGVLPALGQVEPPLSYADSDPGKLGYMQGFPPLPDRVVGYPASNYFSFPRLRWSFCHLREMQATRRIGRGLGPVSSLPERLDPAIDAVTFTPLGGAEIGRAHV